MRSASLRDVAAAVGGVLDSSGRLTVSGVSTDSRTIRRKDLFVALRGDNHDGHHYLSDVKKAGAAAVLVDGRNPLYREFARDNPDFPAVVVRDTLKALGDLAAWVREGLSLEAVGITGSTGKTCTKDFLFSALSTRFKVAASPGSYNNEIGAPLTVFSAGDKDEMLVVEMGARRQGDIKRLAEIVKPRIGLITNVGVTHLELFGSEERIAAAKAELADSLPSDGLLFLNAGDRWSARIAGRTSAEVVRFGVGRGSEYRPSGVRLDAYGRPSFALSGPGFKVAIELPAAGRHQVANACAAASCAHKMGVPPEAIAEGLEHSRLSEWRMEFTETARGCMVINDAYNANPDSMRAALETLGSVGGSRRTVAVLGGMAELGHESRTFHADVGRQLVETDVDVLVTVGRKARDYAASAQAAGMPRGSVFRCVGIDDALSVLSQLIEPEDVVLVKASRIQGLDRLAAALCANGRAGRRRKAAADV